MSTKNKKEEINKINDLQSIEEFLQNSKELFKEIANYNNEESNKKSNIIFKYLSHIQFGVFIIPFLSLKEILSLRLTCKEIDLLINSDICCLNYYYKTLKNHISFNDKLNSKTTKKKFSSQLKPFHELNEVSDFSEQKKILNKIKNYIKSPDFSLEYLIQIYRVEMDYLKYEENHQEKYMNSLIETKKKIDEEYKHIKGKNKKKESLENNINEDNLKKNDINKDKFNLKDLSEEELKKKIEELKIEKENILFKLNSAKKTNEELTSKNEENKKIINKFKNICENNDENDYNNENENENESDNLNIVENFLKNS